MLRSYKKEPRAQDCMLNTRLLSSSQRLLPPSPSSGTTSRARPFPRQCHGHRGPPRTSSSPISYYIYCRMTIDRTAAISLTRARLTMLGNSNVPGHHQYRTIALLPLAHTRDGGTTHSLLPLVDHPTTISRKLQHKVLRMTTHFL